jgi:hypothetical protein
MENLVVHAIKDIRPGEFLCMDHAQTERACPPGISSACHGSMDWS